MSECIAFLNATGGAFVRFAVPMLIQSSIVIVAVLVLDFLLRRHIKAVVRYGIWLLVLLKLLLPPSLAAPTSLVYWIGARLPSLSNPVETVISEPPVAPPDVDRPEQPIAMTEPRFVPPAEHAAPAFDPPSQPATVAPEPVAFVSPPPPPPITWQAMAFLAWSLVVVVMTLLLIQRAFFVRGLVAQSAEAPETMADLLEQCRRQMGVRSPVVLRLTSLSASPSVCGLWRPRILMPQGMVAQLDTRQFKSILLHELAHVKRADLWVNLVQAMLQIVYFFHPLFWLANWMIRRVREQAVDETVLATMGEEAEDYPRTLLNVSKLAFGRPALSLRLIGVVESKKALTARIKHIASRPFPKTAKLGLASLLLVALLLPMAKAKTQDSKTENVVDHVLGADVDTTPEPALDVPEDKIAGVVLDPNGQPIMDAQVTVENKALLLEPEPKQLGNRKALTIRWPYANTDKGGRFRFTDLNPGTTGLRTQLGEPRPATPYELSGIVQNEAGHPISDAEVILAEETRSVGWHWTGTSSTVRTAADGTFQFPDTLEPIVEGSRLRTLFVLKEGYGIWGKKHSSRGDETFVPITLHPEETVSGRVTEVDGKPIPDATVAVSSWHNRNEFVFTPLRDWMPFALRTRTGADGQFTLAALPTDGTVYLRVTSGGYATSEALGIQTGEFGSYAIRQKDRGRHQFGSDLTSETPLEFVLQHAVTLRGTVVYEGTNEPAADIRVAAEGQTRGTWSEDWTDAKGRFEMTDVSSAPCNLMVMQDDLLTEAIPDWTAKAISLDDLEPGETRDDLQLVMTKGGIVGGRVVDSESHPLQGIRIGLHSAAGPHSSAAVQDGTWQCRLPAGQVYAYIMSRRDGSRWQPENRTVTLSAGQTVSGVDFQLSHTLPQNSPYRAKPAQDP